jgi:chromosome segregation ATPase
MVEEDMKPGEGEHFDSLKGRLKQVADEIDTIRTSFTRSTEELSRIQTMLDVGKLDQITQVLENFENRISEAENKRNEAVMGAQKYSEELEKEKERLIKLWDAYKNQEEELSKSEKRMIEFEERMRNAESEKKQIEDDLTSRINTLNTKMQENEEKARQFEEQKSRWEEFDGIRNRLEEEIRCLREDINKKDDKVRSLENQINEYQGYENIKEKYEEVSTNYEKEKERLTKLYHLYEETESENKQLKEEVNSWKEWYDLNKDLFNRLFSTGPPVCAPEPKKKEAIKEETKQEPKKTKKKEKKPKKKRRLKLKK